MIFSVSRKTFPKGKPETVFYCCYKKYDENSFNKALQNKISKPDLSFEKLREIFQSTLDTFASYKQKKIRTNKNLFMTEKFRRELMI